MGSIVEINDTLQITREQGFPAELDYDKHRVHPFKLADVEDKIFEFRDKPGIRIYQSPPVRNFLAENRNGKWIYWGLIHILETTHDHVHKMTSGKFKIIYLYSPDEMVSAHDLTDRNHKTKL